MLTLSEAKQELGIPSDDTSQDADLIRCIRQTVSRIRQQTHRYIAWATDSIVQSGTMLRVRCIGHGLNTAEVVKILNSNSSPSLDGDHLITRVDQDHFDIPTPPGFNDSATWASIHPKYLAEYRAFEPIFLWIPQRYLPLFEIAEMQERTSLTTWEVVSSSDYQQNTNDDQAKSMQLIRTSGCWPVTRTAPRGQYALQQYSKIGNIRMQAYFGSRHVPEEVAMAGYSIVADLWEKSGAPKDQATTFEGVSRSPYTGDLMQQHAVSPSSVLLSWRARGEG